MNVLVTVNSNLEEEVTNVKSVFINRDFVSLMFETPGEHCRTFEKVVSVEVVI